jgi:hypothetical protein
MFSKKHSFYIVILLVISIGLISWGSEGHHAVAKIAENHLTPKTQQAIKALLGNQSLPDVSTWADEIRSNPDYKYTAAWHYVNVPAGLTFDQFADAVKNMPQANVYKMVVRCVLDLKNPTGSKSSKVTALKYLVHLVGDLHQPMHVSRAEDKGGNDISITFMGNDSNLHSLWDSGIISNEGLTYQKMATAYDTATPEQITKWQNDPLMVWLWESYQIAEILYKETAENPKFDQDYYQSHLPIVQNRIAKGGIRLAGILNDVFDK